MASCLVEVNRCALCVYMCPLRVRSTKGGFQIRIVGASLGYRGGSRRILVASHQFPNLTLSENSTEVATAPVSVYPYGWQVRTAWSRTLT